MSATISRQERIQTRKQPNSAKSLKRTLMGASLVEAILGVAAIVLIVIGLSGIVPMMMGAISVIILGIGWLSEAGMLMAEYPKIMHQTQRRVWDKIGSSSGFTAEAITGIAAIVLGILVLLGVAPMFLLSIAAVVLGLGLVLTSAAVSSINSKNVGVLEGDDYAYESRSSGRVSESEGYAYEAKNSTVPEDESYVYKSRGAEAPTGEDYKVKDSRVVVSEEPEERETEAVAHAALSAATGVQVVLGFTVTVLGLLALVGFSPLLLTIVSILVAGIAALMIGAAVSGRMLNP